MRVQKDDLDEPWALNVANETWLLAETATIRSDEDGIISNFANTRLTVSGNVLGALNGVGVLSNDASPFTVTVSKTGWVSDFNSGIYVNNAIADITNAGTISAEEFGIFIRKGGDLVNRGLISSRGDGIISEGALDVENFGSIHATGHAIQSTEFGIVTNHAGAQITSTYNAIWIDGGDTARIVNDGIIRAHGSAIYGENGIDVTIVNRGRIAGNISLGDGDDRIDLRGGVTTGAVNGGQGDDTYFVSGKVRIVEEGASFGDVLKSTITYSIEGNGIDDLYLLGKKNIDGEGNDGDNYIGGNAGKNTLSGGLGEDILDGRAGNDTLEGGGGADIFRFHKGIGVDTITDFEDGVDLISVDDDFRIRDIVSVRQRGDDLVVDFGHGDRLILEDFEKANFGMKDFVNED